MPEDDDQLIFEDPPHHEGRKTWSAREQKGSVPQYALHRNSYVYAADNVNVGCTRCHKSFDVRIEDIQEYVEQTRPCFHCWKPSYIPEIPPSGAD